MRLIDADEIRIKPEYMHDICGSVMIRVEDVARILNEMPTINSQPRQKGKWILVTDNRGQHFECDKCGEWRYYQGQNFCSHCGADMRESVL